MNRIELEDRTKRFAISCLRLASTARHGIASNVMLRQFVKSSTSIGANYREANRAVSRRDFKNKIGTCAKEASETEFWLEVMIEASIVNKIKGREIHAESSELLRIFSAIFRTLSREE